MRPWKPRNLGERLNSQHLRISDHHYGVTLALSRCCRCGFIFAAEEDLSNLTALYQGMDDPQYEHTAGPRALQMRWVLGMVRRAHPTARSLLDVGAGEGLMIVAARRQGLQAVGVEPSRALVASAKEMHDVDLLEGVLPHFGLRGRQFDVVTLVDVIEHVRDPRGLLSHSVDVLAPGGVLAVITPDVRSFAARLFGHRWWHFRAAHVGYFDRMSLEYAGRQVGLVPNSTTRAQWFFPVEYIAQRLEEYVPIGLLNRAVKRIPPLRWLYRRVIPMNLYDSLLVVFSRATKHSVV